MKTLLLNKGWLLVAILASVSMSCKKEVRQQKRAFKLTTETFYRVAPAEPQTITVGGINYLGILYFPGAGTGNATHLGKCTTLFNQLAYILPPQNDIRGSVAAPVTAIPSYPVASGFASYLPAITSLSVPEAINGKIVNTILYNKNGEAIFLSAITGGGKTTFISPQKIAFNGKGLIVGGRGKFEGATGEFDYEGYFNPENNNDAAYNAAGWINY